MYNKPEINYALAAEQIRALAEEEPHYVALLANASALLWELLGGPEGSINWCGFYIMRGGRLVLGPFQGRPACIHIDLSRGVCGAAARTGETQLVPDVHAFPGHIACDEASRSEVVVPIFVSGKISAVLDIDSPEKGHFTEKDARGLELAALAIGETMEGLE